MNTSRSKSSVILVMLTFFVISFITNIMGPIFPALVNDYHISLTIAGFFPFAFFIAYGVMSIPAGIITERLGAKVTMLLGFGLSAAGALLLALLPTLTSVMASLFLIGSAMAMLQVVINPLLRIAGGEENFAFNSVAAQLVFGGAATISPLVYSYLAGAIGSSSSTWVNQLFFWVPQQLSWLSMYGIFALLSLVMILIIAKLNMPKLALNEDEKIGALDVHLELLRSKTVRLFFLAIVAYVATEQGIANSMSLFLQTYHGLNPEVEGANAVSQFWLMMVFGCMLGMGLLRLMDSRTVLKLFSLVAIACYLTALFSATSIALLAFPAVGFCISVMFSIIFSLALNSMPKHHGSFAGILCSGIIGGALASPIIGMVADASGELRTGMFCVFITLGYILSIGFWAKPLVTNKTWNAASET
ncbi:MAG: MFS transporter [Gammaproteobacteria bacterium]|nr:MAG: MFS transporter [Gammaproteobacteria bacterium]